MHFGFHVPQREWIFEKPMQFDLLTNLKWFYIVDKRKNQFGFVDHPFLFSVYLKDGGSTKPLVFHDSHSES